MSKSSSPKPTFLFLGSMNGERIVNAKEALFLFLKSLPADCYFNVISFGNSYSALFSSYVCLICFLFKGDLILLVDITPFVLQMRHILGLPVCFPAH